MIARHRDPLDLLENVDDVGARALHSTLRRGPMNARKAVRLWARTEVESLIHAGADIFEKGLFARLADTLYNHQVYLRTEYSGIGSVEEALEQIIIALEQLGTLLPRPCIVVQRAGAVQPNCRK
eukprot:10311071-Alexandrium_andersonii.AAC.1